MIARMMNLSIGTRYAMIIVSALLLVIGSMAAVLLLQFRSATDEMSALSTHALDDELYRQVRSRGVAVADLLTDGAVTPLYRFDMKSLQDLIRGALAQDDVVYVLVHDENGDLVHDGSVVIENFGKPVADLATQYDRAGNDAGLVRINRPVKMSGTTIGGVSVGLSLSVVETQTAGVRDALTGIIHDARQRILVTTSLITIIFIAAGIVLAMLIARSLVRPIRRLAQHASRVGRGEFSDDIAVGGGNELAELASSFREMSRNLAERTAQVSHLAYHDSLTDLPNRTQLRSYLDAALLRAEVDNCLVALLFIDLDDFKVVNDSFGHDVGDRLLQQFAARITGCLRSSDCLARGQPANELVARLGGDEFTVVLESIPEADSAVLVARRILESLALPFDVGHDGVCITASIGITVYPGDGTTAGDLLRNADSAMYRAKQRGKNQFAFRKSPQRIVSAG